MLGDIASDEERHQELLKLLIDYVSRQTPSCRGFLPNPSSLFQAIDLCVYAPAYPHITLKRRWTTGHGEYDNDLPEHLHRVLDDGQETSRIETTSSHQIVRCSAELAGNIPAMQTSIALRKPQSIFSSAAHLTQHFLTHSGFTCPQVLHTFRVLA